MASPFVVTLVAVDQVFERLLMPIGLKRTHIFLHLNYLGNTIFTKKINPLSANLHALTPISAFRPRRWRGALLPDTAKVCFEVLDAGKRPVSATADAFEVRDVARVEVETDADTAMNVLFDHDHQLEERIIQEQFVH